MSRFLLVAAALLGLGFAAEKSASAQTVLAPTKIIALENGWYGEWMVFSTQAGVAGCPAGPTEFAIDAAHPGYESMVAIALSALSTGLNVRITAEVGTCLQGHRTKVVAVRIEK